LLEIMSDSLATGERIEIPPGLEVFRWHFRPPAARPQPQDRRSRALARQARYLFQAGKDLREPRHERADQPIRD